MLSITSCVNCHHVNVCKYAEQHHSEIEILLTIQNKFQNTDVKAVCKHHNKLVPIPKLGGLNE